MTCENCIKGGVLQGTPKGSMVDDAYFSPSPSTESDSAQPTKNAIVLLSDIFGLPLVNPRLIADILSERVGVDVWVPDLFAGSPPIKLETMTPLEAKRPGATMSFFNKLRFHWVLLTHLWALYRARNSVVDPRTIAFVEKLKKEKQYGRIGAVGYCFGGAIAIRLGSKSVFDTLVIAHPAALFPNTIEEIQAINVPSAWALAEEDPKFNHELRNGAEAVFAARKGTPGYIDYEFKDYEGTVHGFAARPDDEVPESVAGFQGAIEQTVAWFIKTLNG